MGSFQKLWEWEKKITRHPGRKMKEAVANLAKSKLLKKRFTTSTDRAGHTMEKTCTVTDGEAG